MANLKKPTSKGLKKLPKKVRNKIGFMKKGGAVKKKKGYAKGGAVRKMMGGGVMKIIGYAIGGAIKKRK